MNNPFKNIYKGKKVLITGHTGFKGSWLTTWLIQLGAQVTGYSLEPPTKPNMFEICGLHNKITHITGDIRSEEKLKNIFKEYKPEIVFHMAAQPLVMMSYKNPRLTYETNIMGTVNVFEAVRASKSVEVVVNITSDKCYENKEWIYGYREIDPMGGYDPYSSSKGCSELVTSAYRNSYFNPENHGNSHNVTLASVRAGNVIGGGDWAENRLIPDCIKSLIQKETIIIRNPKAIRPWQHVLEPLSGYLWLGSLIWRYGPKFGECWNFGPSDNNILTVEEIVNEIIHLWGNGKYLIDNNSKLHEVNLLKLDINKSKYYLGWKPVYDINESLKQTINWYLNYYNKKENMYKHTLKQIKNYIKSAKKYKLTWATN